MNVFFFFSKILTVILFPLPLCILLGLLIVLFKIKGGRNKFLSFLPIGLLWFAASFPVCQSLITSLEKEFPPIKVKDAPRADAIVVLGGMINTLSPFPDRVEILGSGERLTDAILLHKAGKAEYVLFTGGSGLLFDQEVKEAGFAKKFLIDFGIPENKILLESESRNTFENALYTKKILEEKKIERIILVTSAFHMKRSIAIFQKLGIEAYPFPTDYRSLRMDLNWEIIIPATGALETTTIAIKEWMGILMYQWKGYM
ncbi:MAG TPA: YdcF family protein [Leptospiraceae bacterium]|nr:YdcF family protein [Leptospiraceae bacterium]HMW05936.1 YdcF family protein [Leptospiraceae bacterium]HMX34552.1 YdcF family protein [Leptospiraceae bacterium]HMY32290.1 YdcF family protein [Leptospiraceae bacterium]HMZ62508.1 YdcF family protein [Leptospiraceae bacterium]